MCGILGCLFHLERPQFQQALETLHHRGPDSFGILSQREVTLGHTRLAILDLSENGQQPMADATGRFTIIFNGEIYNYQEIRKELLAQGVRFRSQSDTEVFLESFKMWGADCLNRFNGMWAAAIWDATEKTVFLSRDRFGKKPLYYAHTRRGVVFASEMKAIYPFLDEVRPSALLPAIFATPFSYEAGADCIIAGVRRFPAGHCAYVEPDGVIRPRRYYDLSDRIAPTKLGYEEAVERFRELFLSAVTLRMRSDVPLGTALSGGLDSSATFSAMAIQSQEPLLGHQSAYCAHFPGSQTDETGFARLVTGFHGHSLNEIEIDPLSCWNDIEYYLYMMEDPYLTPPIPMVMTYGAMRAGGVIVTLDGHGADELLSGYGASVFEALPDGGIGNALELARTFVALTATSADGQFSNISPLKALMTHGLRRGMRHLLRPAPYGKGLAGRDDCFTRHLLQLFAGTVLPTLLRNYDRYSMMNGVEIRMPFMDFRVVEFLFSLPWNYKLRDGFTKKILRDAVAPYLPPQICWRKSKVGFNSPMVDWFRGPLKEWTLDLINSSSFAQHPWVDYRKTQETARRIHCGPATWQDGERLWDQIQRVLWLNSLRYSKRFSPAA